MAEETKQEVKIQPDSIIDKTEKLVAELKAENDRKEALLLKEEKLRATEMLAGKANAGEPQKKEDESPLSYMKRIMGRR